MKKFFLISLVATAIVAFSSCQDSAWDDHYDYDGTSTASTNLIEALRQNSQFSQFLSIVEQQGLDSLLSTDQSFTVWAPTNDAMASYAADSNPIDHFIKNHVSRYIYTNSDLADTTYIRIKMLNGKFQDFSRATGAYSFADIPLTGTSIACTNGLIHQLSSVAPFYLNLYEEIKSNAETTELSAYLQGFDEYEFDASQSTTTGKNSLGQIVYDSVFNYTNDWMRAYGSLYLEDSTYTMIVPTNTGWAKGYERVYPYFRTFGTLQSSSENNTTHVPKRTYAIDDQLADSLSNVYTKENMVKNLVFRKKVDPFNAPGDSLQNTAGNSFHHLGELFGSLTEQTVSNGTMWKTNDWTLRPDETFLKDIEVEAENTTGRTYAYSNVISRDASSTSYADSVSGQKFIEVTASTTNARTQPMVQFTIPNVLAATYDVYVIFAPAEASSEGVAADSTRVNFYLNYVHEDGQMTEDAVINGGVTLGTGMTRMYVTRITFPYSNFSLSQFDGDATQDDDCVRLRIQTSVASSETTKMTRTMRIDKIVMRPVTDDSF